MKKLGAGKGESPRIYLRVPESLHAALQRLAEKDRRDLVDYVRLALTDHVASVTGRTVDNERRKE